jgi:predicted Zn-dependent protease with MMP-like domain
MAVDSTAFDRLVAAAYERIPARYSRRMKNIAVMVEPEPTQAQLARGRVPRGGTLLGLYEGRPLTSRSVFEPFAMPDRITIFQGPHEHLERGPEHLAHLVEDTLWHEVARYFGMNEAHEAQVRAADRRRYYAPETLARFDSTVPPDRPAVCFQRIHHRPDSRQIFPRIA